MVVGASISVITPKFCHKLRCCVKHKTGCQAGVIRYPYTQARNQWALNNNGRRTLGQSQGFLARQFNAASQNAAFIYIRKKLTSLALAFPLLALSPAFAVSVQSPHTPPDIEPQSSTLYSRSVDDFNRRFAVAGPHNRILFIDRDDVARRRAQMPRGVGPETAMAKAVEDYVLERTGLRLPEAYSEVIAEGILGGGGQAVPIAYKDDAGTVESMCVVNGKNPDVSALSYQQRIMGLYEGIHDDFRNRPMRENLSPAVVEKFTDYHELGHCMDNQYIMAFLNDAELQHDIEKRTYTSHRAEMFGEVFAALMLARDGETHVAGIRADQRLIAIATNGILLGEMAGWESSLKYGGFIYALHEGLWDAQREIDRLGVDRLRTMSSQDIAALAHQITERDPLSAPGADHAVTYLLQSKLNLDVWEDLRHQYPHIEIRYQVALKVRNDIADAFVRVYGAEAFDPSRPVYQQIIRDASVGPVGRISQVRLQEDTTRLSTLLRQASGRHDNPEMNIVLNAVREKERLRAMLNDPAISKDRRDQAVIGLALMPDAMRTAILSLRQENHAVLSVDNHIRAIPPAAVPVTPPAPRVALG